MTTSDEITSSLDDLRNCGICSGTCREPRTLDCIHSFCLDCLKTILASVTEQDTFACPKCKLKVTPPPGTSLDNAYLESLGKSAVFTAEASLPGVLYCREHPGNECAYFLKDSWVPVCEVCFSSRQSECVPINNRNAVWSRDFTQKELKATLDTTRHDLMELCQSLNSRERGFMSKKDDLVLGILKYFGDLKSKMLEYLIKLESEVLDKLNNFTACEMKDIRLNSDHCFSFLDSLSSTFSRVERKFDKSDDDNALIGYQGLALLQEHLNDYTSKISSLKTTISDQKEIRFIINTEFEDMLLEGDLINVELLDSSVRSRSTGATEVSQEQRNTPQVEIRSESQGGMTAPTLTLSPATASFDDEPPPPYPGQFSPNQQVGRTQVPPNSVEQRPRPSAPTVDDFVGAPTVPRQLTHGASFESQLSLGSNESSSFCFRSVVKFTSRSRANEKIPVIGDICWVNSRVLLIADKRNSCLKVFTTRGTCINQCVLIGEPYGCVVFQNWSNAPKYQNKVAVTFPKQKKVVLYNIDIEEGCSMTYESEFVTRVGYTCITYYEPKKYFICGTTTPFSFPAVDILQVEFGNSLGLVESIKDYNGIAFGYPRYVSVNTEGVIAMSDYKSSKVIFFDLTGRYEGMFDGSRSRNLQDPQGIGVFDHLFIVADTRRNNLFCVDSDQNVYGEMHAHDLLEKTPRFVSVSPSQRPLMAIGHGNGTISLYDVWNESQSFVPENSYDSSPTPTTDTSSSAIPDGSSYV